MAVTGGEQRLSQRAKVTHVLGEDGPPSDRVVELLLPVDDDPEILRVAA